MAATLRQARGILTKYPLLWNSALYFGLYSASEWTQQTFRGQTPKDIQSISNIAILGGVVFAPFNYNWYKILDRAIIGTGLKFAAKKVVCDMLIGGSCGIALFYVGLAVLEGRNDKFAELKQKGKQTYMIAWLFWPAVQMANFLYLPPHLRTAYVGCAAFCWANILCFLKNKSS